MKLDEKKGIVSLVKNDFTPLEESKEGYLKGGFGAVIQMATSSARVRDNCTCDGDNNCQCDRGRDNCNCANGGSCNANRNNCDCNATTLPPTTPGITAPTTTPTTNMLAGFGF